MQYERELKKSLPPRPAPFFPSFRTPPGGATPQEPGGGGRIRLHRFASRRTDRERGGSAWDVAFANSREKKTNGDDEQCLNFNSTLGNRLISNDV